MKKEEGEIRKEHFNFPSKEEDTGIKDISSSFGCLSLSLLFSFLFSSLFSFSVVSGWSQLEMRLAWASGRTNAAFFSFSHLHFTFLFLFPSFSLFLLFRSPPTSSTLCKGRFPKYFPMRNSLLPFCYLSSWLCFLFIIVSLCVSFFHFSFF